MELKVRKSLLTLITENQMKPKILLWLILVASLTVQASQPLSDNHIWSKHYGANYDANCLLESYSEIKKNIEINHNNKIFMDCFPKNFDRFVDLFGYQNSSYFDGENGMGILTIDDVSVDLINYFFELNTKDDNVSRVLLVAVNGFWQLDNIGVFQHYLRDFVKENQDDSFEYLDSLSQRDLDSFWFFFFDGRYPDKVFPNYVKENKSISHRVLSSAESAHKNALKNKI